MKPKYLFLLFLFFPLWVQAQDTILARIIFIGDAGEMDKQQTTLIPDAASRIIKGKTTVMYLGDNIYPRGMGLPGSKEEVQTQQILQSQFAPMRSKGAAVYFIPGNHDWDRMGPEGLAKIKRQWAYLDAQNDSLLQMVPRNGCPDPVAIPITDSLVIIAMDSEWWVFPFDKDNPEADCDCTSERDVIAALRELFYKNRYKTILLAMHHPFQSYGTHGGYFSWKDHLFPLTIVSPKLYIPLPVIGSLYPLLRRTFTNPEDLHHPLYKEMIKDVDKVFSGFPNLIHIAGHEHGLQLINNTHTGQLQIISGGGAKQNYTMKGKYSLFGEQTQGYVIADLLRGDSLRFTFFTYSDSAMHKAFVYFRKHQPYKIQEDATDNAITTDSVIAAAHPAYDKAGRFARFWTGENYRKEWAQPAKLPVIRISEIDGGLVPEKLGGGFQTTSLRLKDKNDREYTLRSVEKNPDKVVPRPFQGTFVRELMDDATSAQHPYSALMVPPVAHAVNVPHSNPVIGVVAPDKDLGMYQKLFAGKVTLLEEREPLGESDNYIKTLQKLQEDNDNSYDANNFLRARMIDLLFADWDRHGDQWRFVDHKDGKGKYYLAVPRDRDMVLNVTQGIIPSLLKRIFLMPHVFGFREKLLPGSKYYLYKSSFLNAHPASQISYENWMKTANAFKASVTDSVLETSLKQLPAEIYPLKHDALLADLKARRDEIPEAMDKYYRLSNRIVDIHTSDKNEFADIRDLKDSNALEVTIRKISKHGELEDTLMSKIYPAGITKEIRLYVSNGDDSVVINNQASNIKLRIIGGKGDKVYNIESSRKKINLYDREDETYLGTTKKLQKHLHKDSLQTEFIPVNLYNTTIPLVTAAINMDDGIYLGAGLRYMRQGGFRKSPYTSLHQFTFAHSFSTDAFKIDYKSEWTKVFGNADILLKANIKAPNNTQNFFGRGNETPFDKTGDYKKYYRTRFNLFELHPALRWNGQKGSSVSIGPAVQYYHFDKQGNAGRFINNTTSLRSYDSATIADDKAHLGLIINYRLDQRNDKTLPAYGTYINVQLQGFTGLNGYSKSFARIIPEIALYKSLNAKQTIIFADRAGGGISLGKTTFYQSLFLGGGENLSGYRKYRFAGQHSLYNNMELRIALSRFGNYLMQGEFGITGFYDIGRVWQSGESSEKWHNGIGGGLYFAPAYLTVFRLSAGYSSEGWYPYFSMGFRF